MLEKEDVEGKDVEKKGNPRKHGTLRFHTHCGEKGRFSPLPVERKLFHTILFLFPQKKWKEKAYRLELILVLISLTVSAKAGSFFICFSTCLMEYRTVE